jgi:pilus assembly protein Flp/PilA
MLKTALVEMVANLVKEEEGQALTEYGLILGLIAVVCVSMLGLMGTRINGLLDTITKAMPSAGGAAGGGGAN